MNLRKKAANYNFAYFLIRSQYDGNIIYLNLHLNVHLLPKMCDVPIQKLHLFFPAASINFCEWPYVEPRTHMKHVSVLIRTQKKETLDNTVVTAHAH